MNATAMNRVLSGINAEKFEKNFKKGQKRRKQNDDRLIHYLASQIITISGGDVSEVVSLTVDADSTVTMHKVNRRRGDN